MKKDIPNLDSMSREELLDLLKRYVSEYNTYSMTCKGKIGVVAGFDRVCEESRGETGGGKETRS